MARRAHPLESLVGAVEHRRAIPLPLSATLVALAFGSITTNMFGDIISDEASELSGSLGLGGAINASETHCMAQAQHGSAPDIAGFDKANPTSLILSVGMLLDWLARKGHAEPFARAARVIDESIDALVSNAETRTLDLGGRLGTKAFTERLCAELTQRLRNPR